MTIHPLIAHGGAPDDGVATAMVIVAAWVLWIGRRRLKGTGFQRLPQWSGMALLIGGTAIALSAFILPEKLLGLKEGVGPRPSSEATISIVEPSQGEAVQAGVVDLQLRLEGGEIVEATTTDLQPDTGHIHVSVNGVPVSMNYGTEQTVDLTGMSPGSHTISAEYVAADHFPFEPRVMDESTVTISE